MSGSGGFYKYRCKYFYAYDCNNWVFVNNSACADCCAAGRDNCDGADDEWQPDIEISYPIFQDGILRYAMMGVSVSAEPGNSFTSWTPRDDGIGGGALRPRLPMSAPTRQLVRSNSSHHQQLLAQSRMHLPPNAIPKPFPTSNVGNASAPMSLPLQNGTIVPSNYNLY